MLLKKQYAGSMDSTLTPKIYRSIKYTQRIIPDLYSFSFWGGRVAAS